MSTLIRPPPHDPSKSTIEGLLQLTGLSDIDPDLFTNTQPLWHPPGARGVFGGAVIAHCLVAAQRTVPKDFTIHSMHCYFVLAGSPDIPIMYHVEHVREGRSFATRTVQARQRGRVIFTTTLSFVKENSGGAKKVEHAYEMPDVPAPLEGPEDPDILGRKRPFITQTLDILNDDCAKPYVKKTRQWVKARDTISPEGGHQAHEAALAYVSDSAFVGTIARVHGLWLYSPKRAEQQRSTINEEILKKILSRDDHSLKRGQGLDKIDLKLLRSGMNGLSKEELRRPEIGIMVSLDHTIYFHNPRAFRADEWMLSEMETPWAGDGRGLVFQKIFGKDGTLIATCVQEGLVRLKQEQDSKL